MSGGNGLDPQEQHHAGGASQLGSLLQRFRRNSRGKPIPHGSTEVPVGDRSHAPHRGTRH